MERKTAMFAAAVLATLGVAAGAWSLLKLTPGGTSSREFGRVGMSEAPERPGGSDGELREFAGGDQVAGAPEGASRLWGEEMPEGMRAMLAGDGLDPSTFDFPEIDSESDARAMLADLRSAIAGKASGATAYRQAPPIGKQRFTDEAIALIEPFFIPSLRDEELEARSSSRTPMVGDARGLEGAYFGKAMEEAAIDVAHLAISDAPELPVFKLPEGLGLPTERIEDEGGDGERAELSMRVNFTSGAGGWSRHQINHPMAERASQRPEEAPLAQITLPLRAERLGDDIADARFDATLWWDQDAQRWRPGDVTVRYKTKPDPDSEQGSRMEMIRE